MPNYGLLRRFGSVDMEHSVGTNEFLVQKLPEAVFYLPLGLKREIRENLAKAQLERILKQTRRLQPFSTILFH